MSTWRFSIDRLHQTIAIAAPATVRLNVDRHGMAVVVLVSAFSPGPQVGEIWSWNRHTGDRWAGEGQRHHHSHTAPHPKTLHSSTS